MCNGTHTHVCACAAIDVLLQSCHRKSERSGQFGQTIEKQLYGQTMDALFVASNLRG